MSFEYRYRAKKWNGKYEKGVITAENSSKALENLSARNLVPIELKLDERQNLHPGSFVLKILTGLGFRPAGSRELMIFSRQYATMLRAGISALRALHVLAEQKEIAALRKYTKSAALKVEEGHSLASALRNQDNCFPEVMTSMIEAGEASGKLDTVMEKMADHFENQNDFSQKIRSATLYPLFILCVAACVVVIMVVYVLPQFAQIFASTGMEMPLYTRTLLALAAGLARYRLLIPVVLTAGFLFYRNRAKTKKGREKIDFYRLSLPFFGKIYKMAATARLSRTLSTLLASGIGLSVSLSIADKVVGNTILSTSINRWKESLNQGETMHKAMLDDRYFPFLLAEMVRVGEETGTLDQTLDKTALFYEREVAYVVDRLGSILEPVLLLVVGLVIGLLVLSVLSPMYRIFEMI